MKDLFDTISGLYTIDEIISAEKLKTGVYTHNYILHTSSKRYFLKNYREPEEKLTLIHSSMKYFKQKGIPTSLPYTFHENKTFFDFEGDIYALFPYIEGIKVNRDNVTTRQARALGEMLAKIHLISEEDIPEEFLSIIKREKSLEERLEKINKVKETVVKKNSTDSFDRKILSLLDLKTDLLKKHSNEYSQIILPKKTLVHGDFHVENVFFNKENEIIEVFDFDKVKINDRESEVVWALFISFMETAILDESVELSKEFLSSYHKLYPLHLENFEKAMSTYYFGLFRIVWAEEEYYLQGNHRVQQIIENDINRLELLEKGNSSLIAELGKALV